MERFLNTDPRPKAIFLNSPHNPTGGVATEDDLRGLADLVRGRDVAVLSDEPYSHMVWRGRHHSLLAQPGMLDQCVAAYTFSKSYSMSGWRLGFAVASADDRGDARQAGQHQRLLRAADRATGRHRRPGARRGQRATR